MASRLSFFSPQDPLRSLLTLFISWKLALFFLVLAAPGPGYDTSSTLLRSSELQSDVHLTVADPPGQVQPLIFKFVRWDAIFFTSISNRGLVFEQEWAFGLGISGPISLFSAVISIGRDVESTFGAKVLAGVLLSHCAHLCSVLLLYSLCKKIYCRNDKSGTQMPFIAAAMHTISPAGVFLSAPYAESLFSSLNLLGFYLYIDSISSDTNGKPLRRDIMTVAAGFAFACATLVRSNGLLSGIPFFYDATAAGLSIVTEGFSTKTFHRLFNLCLGGSLIAMGALLPQYNAYRLYCAQRPAGHRRPWCEERFPSVYGWVQSNYWNVGMFRYWTLSNLPLFLLAAPCLWMLCHSAAWAWRFGHPKIRSRRESTGTDQLDLFQTRSLQRMAMPQLVLAMTAFTSFHVQVITRLSSAYPLWYIWLAEMVTKRLKGGSESSAGTAWPKADVIVRWMVIYAGVQGGLFASFLPPA